MSSSSGLLLTQLAAVMESLVHAAVAELKELLEDSLEVQPGEETPLPARLQTDSRDKTVRSGEAGDQTRIMCLNFVSVNFKSGFLCVVLFLSD